LFSVWSGCSQRMRTPTFSPPPGEGEGTTMGTGVLVPMRAPSVGEGVPGVGVLAKAVRVGVRGAGLSSPVSLPPWHACRSARKISANNRLKRPTWTRARQVRTASHPLCRPCSRAGFSPLAKALACFDMHDTSRLRLPEPVIPGRRWETAFSRTEAGRCSPAAPGVGVLR